MQLILTSRGYVGDLLPTHCLMLASGTFAQRYQAYLTTHADVHASAIFVAKKARFESKFPESLDTM